MDVKDLLPVIEEVKSATSGRLEKIDDSMKDLKEKQREIDAMVLDLAQRSVRPRDYVPTFGGDTSIVNVLEKSEDFVRVRAGLTKSARFALPKGSLQTKAAIVNATGQNQPLVAADRQAGIFMPAQRRLTIRDLIPVVPTDSNLIEYVKETGFTNNAGPQYSATGPAYENVAKAESALAFSLSTAPVVTIAHWIPASKQVLADSRQLQDYIGNRLRYGLALEEEREILNGDGTAGKLSGLMANATAFLAGVSGDTKADTLRRVKGALAVNEYSATGIVINPLDWERIELLKDSEGRYLFANPQNEAQPRMWGIPVVATNSIAEDNFLMGDFGMAARLFDREDAHLEIGPQHADFFIKNMVALLAEERVALAVMMPAALMKGTFSTLD